MTSPKHATIKFLPFPLPYPLLTLLLTPKHPSITLPILIRQGKFTALPRQPQTGLMRRKAGHEHFLFPSLELYLQCGPFYTLRGVISCQMGRI